MTLPRPQRGPARDVSAALALAAVFALPAASAVPAAALAAPSASAAASAARPTASATSAVSTARPGNPRAGTSHPALSLDLDGPGLARESAALRRRGFRPLSLDAYGDPARPRFASTWIREGGADWFLALGVGEAALPDSLAAWGGRGWQPAMITGTGAAPAFAVLMERDSLATKARAALDRDGFRQVSDSAQRAGYRPAWVDAYGTPGRPLFASVWKKNDGGVPWNYSLGDDAAALREKAATFAPTWVRPALVVPTPDGRLFTLWEEGSVGGWALHAALPAREAGAVIRSEAARGRHPLYASGPARPGDGFTVVFASSARPLPKAFTVTGPPAPGLEAFDDYVERLMRAHQVRSGSLAMVKDGRLVMARGYTWAEQGYPITEPNSLFRVASCSKPLTSIAIHRMLKEGGSDGPLYLKEKVLSLLKPGDGAAPADKRFEDITIDDLLSHSAGWVRSPEHPDPVFNDYPAGHAIRRRLPAMAKDFLGYMLGQPLQFAPGSQSAYANFGYFLLGRILETLPHGAGSSYGHYEQAMADLVFKPLGLTRPRFGSSRLEERMPGEVLYHTRSPYLQRGREPGGPAWVTGAYGDFELHNMEAAGAWILSTADYAKVLASFDLGDRNPLLGPEAVRTMWAPPHNPRFLRGWFATRFKKQADGDTVVAKWHNGLFPGTSTLVYYRPDKWSFALFLNRDVSPQLSGDKEGREMGRLADQVKAWPEKDLFPEMGIRPFVAAADSDAGADGAAAPAADPEAQGSPRGRGHFITSNP